METQAQSQTQIPEINSKSPQVLQGKLKQIFEIEPNIKNKIRDELTNLYKFSSFRNSITPEKVHQIILNTFTNDYYPIISRSLRADNDNTAVIMGGVAFNMNVPKKMVNFLDTPTDDIDLKIYTTHITENNKTAGNIGKVLSIFRFMIVIICMYLKQVATLIMQITDELFEENIEMDKNKKSNQKSNKKGKTLKNTKGGARKTQKSSHNIKKTGKNTGKTPKVKINQTQKTFGIIKNSKPFIIIKTPEGNESIDISILSYEDTFKLINEKITTIDLLITNKMYYYIRYMKPYAIPHNKMKITISDSKIIYANKDYPAFYSYYFMKNRKAMDKTLSQLYKSKLTVSDIIDTKPCRNNCKYIAVDSLLLDISLMLGYANKLEKEDVPSGNVLVPIGSVYKYYKYMVKFIKLHIIKKYYNGTLSVKFINPAKKLIRYVKDTIDKKTELSPESAPLNLQFKKLLNTFHQDFFINKTLLSHYIELKEIVETFQTYTYFIDRSREKFKQEDEQKGGSGGRSSTLSKTIMYKDVDYDDYELDNLHYSNKEKNKLIREKISNMLKQEINNLNRLTRKI